MEKLAAQISFKCVCSHVKEVNRYEKMEGFEEEENLKKNIVRPGSNVGQLKNVQGWAEHHAN